MHLPTSQEAAGTAIGAGCGLIKGLTLSFISAHGLLETSVYAAVGAAVGYLATALLDLGKRKIKRRLIKRKISKRKTS